MVRSFVGFFISVGENPELILEQNIRDMNDQVPRMNESIAMVKANVTLLEKEEARYKNQVNDLTAKVKASIKAGRDDLAGSFAVQLEQVRGALARTQGQLQTAHAAFDKAMAVKKAFMLEKERKTQEALNAIRDYRRAQWQKKVADSMESFEVAGISADARRNGPQDRRADRRQRGPHGDGAGQRGPAENQDRGRGREDARQRAGQAVQGGDGTAPAAARRRARAAKDHRGNGAQRTA